MKTMHKIITLLLIVGMTGLFNTRAMAQLNEKFKKKAEQEQAEDKDKDKSGKCSRPKLRKKQPPG